MPLKINQLCECSHTLQIDSLFVVDSTKEAIVRPETPLKHKDHFVDGPNTDAFNRFSFAFRQRRLEFNCRNVEHVFTVYFEGFSVRLLETSNWNGT